MTLQELEAVVQKHMLLADPHIIRLLCAFVIASRLPLNPVWLFIVGPPSGGKSQLLKSLHGVEGVVPIDDLTAQTFSSGMRGQGGQSNSLLDKLLPNSILLFKDFTTIISKEDVSRGTIIGQMRKIYDGDFVKRFGTGEITNWKGKLSVLAGVTQKIYPSMGMFAAMGERFLMWEFQQPDAWAVGKLAAGHLDDAPANEEMLAAFTEFLNDIILPTDIKRVDEITENQIVDLAVFVTRARTPTERKKYSRDDYITQVYKPEQPPRFVKQVLGIALGLQALRPDGKLTDEDRHILRKMALDSIPTIRRQCLQALAHYDLGVATRALAGELNYPVDTVKQHLQDLAAMEVVDYLVTTRQDRWKLRSEYRTIVETYEGITPTGTALEDKIELPIDQPTVEEVGI